MKASEVYATRTPLSPSDIRVGVRAWDALDHYICDELMKKSSSVCVRCVHVLPDDRA